MISINQKDLAKQAKRISRDFIKKETELEKRTLNAVSKKAVTKSARDISQASGVKVGTAKKSIKEKRATTNNLEVKWDIRGRRLTQPGLREVRKKGRSSGISFLGKNKVRKTVTVPVEAGGSPPFVINGKNSGKKIAVFVPTSASKSFRIKGSKGKWGGRKVKTYAGHSLPFYLKQIWGSEELFGQNVKEFIREIFPEERRNQKKRMEFVK